MKIRMNAEINASAEAVWSVLAENFGDLGWSSDITSSTLDTAVRAGAVRTCHFPPNWFVKAGVARVRLIEFDRAKNKFAYELIDPPAFMGRVANHWTIVPLGPERCRVESRATVELVGFVRVFTPFVRFGLLRMGHKFLADLKAHLASEAVRGALPAC